MDPKREMMFTTFLDRAKCITSKYTLGDMSRTHPALPKIISAVVKLVDDIRFECSSGSSVRQTKALDQIIGDVKKDERLPKEFLTSVSDCVGCLLWATLSQTKVNRKILQLLSVLEKKSSNAVSQAFQAHLQPIQASSNVHLLSLWGSLLAQLVCAKEVVREQRLEVLQALASLLDQCVSAQPPWTVARQECLHAVVKIILELEEVLVDDLQQELWHNTAPGDSFIYWTKIAQSLIKILEIKGPPIDGCLMAGTVLVCLLFTNPDVPAACNASVHLYQSLGKGNLVHIGLISLTTGTSSEKDCSRMGPLSVANGILANVNADALHQSVSQRKGEELSLLVWLFDVICEFCHVAEYQYQAFRLLVHWYQKVNKLYATLPDSMASGMFHSQGHLVSRSLSVMFTHLDTPVEKVSECMTDIFRSLLALERLDSKPSRVSDESASTNDAILVFEFAQGIDDKKKCDTYTGFSETQVEEKRRSPAETPSEKPSESAQNMLSLVETLVDRVMQMSWQVKGRHLLMAVLLEFVNVEKLLQTHPALVSDLTKGLSINYLAVPVTSVYRTILAQISNKKDDDLLWQTYVQPYLIAAITTDNSLLWHNAGHNWLPVTLKVRPRSLPPLIRQLQQDLDDPSMQGQRSHTLHGLVGLLKVARAQQLLQELPTVAVEEALCSLQDNIRLEAFTLICVSPKRAERVSVFELAMLREHLPHNMNIDCPPFRQQLRGVVSQALVRLRDGALAIIRNKSKHTGDGCPGLQDIIDFLEWLWRMCLDSLHPGANYQRLKSALDLAQALLEVLTPQPDKRKGGCPETIKDLLKAARDQGKLDFCATRNTITLLTCLLHGTDEVRESAASILLRYFPWPLSGQDQDEALQQEHHGDVIAEADDFLCSLVAQALVLCNSASARDCESGAVIVKLIFQRCVLEQGMTFLASHDLEKGKHFNVTLGIPRSGEEAALEWLSALLVHVEKSVEAVGDSVLQAAKDYPSHGFVLVLSECLPLCSGRVKNLGLWRSFVTGLQAVVGLLVEHVLSVFGGKLHGKGKESAPSFEQMSVAIQQVIREEAEEEDIGCRDNTVLSTEYQLLNTWCWLNIRECSILLGRLVSSFALGNDCSNDLVPVKEVHDIGQMFFRILTKCRHRGALEGCSAGFLLFCHRLLCHPDLQVCVIPGELLQQVLNQVRESSTMSSVTRRSAGLPLIVQNVVASEAKTRQTGLLTHTIETLLEVARQPSPSDPDQQQDLPQIHAMNILRAVFRESSVSQAILPHIGAAALVAVEGFSSPSWALRNAATQLFGVLQARMLGQKKTRDDSLHSTTAPEFFMLYPALQQYMLKMVRQTAQQQWLPGQLSLHPSLFPVLSLLAKLAPGLAETGKSVLEAFQEPVMGLAASPLYAIRALAAQALVAMVSQQDVAHFLQRLVCKVPVTSVCAISFNELHGLLLQIDKLLCFSIQHTLFTGETLTVIFDGLQACHWLASGENPCYLVRACYLQLLLLLCESTHQQLSSSLVTVTCASDTDQTVVKPGQSQSLSMKVKVTLGAASQSPEALTAAVRRYLHCDTSTDVRLACLNYLQHALSSTSHDVAFWRETQALLFTHVTCCHGNWEELCLTLQMLNDIRHLYKLCELRADRAQLWSVLMNLISREVNSRPAALALVVSATVLEGAIDKTIAWEEVERWSELLERCCNPLNAELLRLCAARALCIVASDEHFLTMCRDVCSTNTRRLLRVTLELLTDEDAETRNTAAKFVLKLKPGGSKFVEMHFNTAFKILMDFLSEHFCKHTAAVAVPWLTGLMQQHEACTAASVLQQELSPRREEVFVAQDANPYREQVFINQHITACVKKLSLSDTPATSKEMNNWLQQESTCVVQDLEKVHHILSGHLSDAGIFNMTCSKHAYEAMHTLVCRADILLHCSSQREPSEVDAPSIRQSLLLLSKMPTLHRGLQSVLGYILQTSQSTS